MAAGVDLSSYAGLKGHLWETGKWLLDKWDNNRFALKASARAPRKEPMLPLIHVFFTFSSPSHPISISPSLPLHFPPSVLLPPILSHKAVCLIFLLFLLSSKQMVAMVPALQAATLFPHFIFLPAQAPRFRLSAALQRLPQQGAASALASQTSAG